MTLSYKYSFSFVVRYGYYVYLNYYYCYHNYHILLTLFLILSFTLRLYGEMSTISNWFNYFVSEIIDLLFIDCCGGCLPRMQSVNYSNPYEFADALNNDTVTATITFPVLGRIHTEKLLGHYFVPFYKMSVLTVITKPKGFEELMKELISSCLKLWPLLSICLIMALIAGFFMWIMVIFCFCISDFAFKSLNL